VTDEVVYIWSFECIIFYGDLEAKPVPGIWAATITLIQINSACCKEKWADCDPEEQKKKVKYELCRAQHRPLPKYMDDVPFDFVHSYDHFGCDISYKLYLL
jgi:hypothetical protein